MTGDVVRTVSACFDVGVFGGGLGELMSFKNFNLL